MAQSEVRLEGFTRFDYDPDKLKDVLRGEGREITKIARRWVSRAAVSEAGEFAGKRSGYLRRTIKAKVSRSGYLVVITHQIRQAEPKYRYPFILGYGVKKTKLDARADHMAEAMKQRRNASRNALKTALHRTLSAK